MAGDCGPDPRKMKFAEGLSGEICCWLRDLGWSDPHRIFGGRNNRIFKVSGDGSEAALKIYYRGGGDARDRYSHEKTFYGVANARGASAPHWLSANDRLGVSLLEWIEGEPVPLPAGGGDVLAAAAFLNRINKEKIPAELERMHASEACFSVADHTALLERRIAVLEESAKVSGVLAEFMATQLRPAAQQAQEKLRSDKNAEFREWGGSRIFSPGDFGLHNALRQADGRVVFFDFEYAGWDDPAKTVADVFLQPEKPVDWDLLGEFCDQLDAWPGLEDRVRSWIPFYAAKWAVILMNSAARDGVQRRVFAEDSTDDETLLRQIKKARGVLERGRQLSQ
ncbi:MAG: hypothetical protein FGM15_11115 [Chthoniobacterales bacterium]|nr:hypothetical protein [Chthoniobacterales bacterium]